MTRRSRLWLALASLAVWSLPASAQQTPAPTSWPWRTEVMGTNGMVAAEHPMQALAGLRVLEKGGNAIDAAVAVFYMTAVTEQHQAGLGGDAFILAYIAKRKQVIFINGTGPAPERATMEFFRDKLGGIPLNGPYSSNVPGSVAAFDLALRSYGTKGLAALTGDAISAAEQGHPLTHFAARTHAEAMPMLLQYPSSRDSLTKSGRAFEAGDLFVQPDLARSLRAIVREGADSFYRGTLARLTAATYQKYDGLLRYEDLAAFRAEESEPVHSAFRDYTVYQAGANSQGIVQLIAMNILKGFDLKALGHNSPEYLHVLIEALKLAFADRDQYISDPRRSSIPAEALLSEQYAAARRKLIRMDRAIRGAAPPGDPRARRPILEGREIAYEDQVQAVRPEKGPAHQDGETSSFSIADRFGNVVSVTHSVNGTFGSGLVVERGGYVLNNRLPYFSLEAGDVNALAPGKRTLHTICPALALLDGKPVMAWNTPGGDNQPQALLQAFLNVVEFGMGPQYALEQPTVTTTCLRATMYPHKIGGTVLIPESLAAKVGPALARKGHKLEVRALQQPYFQQTAAVGAVKMTLIDPRTGVMRGAVSPAKDDYVMGW
ncbi:MAG: gamma-glutamyltransferase [Acidobacteriia bacterium]|nr:gamma-glutamyltransferase [Terriglobia bacterium]